MIRRVPSLLGRCFSRPAYALMASLAAAACLTGAGPGAAASTTPPTINSLDMYPGAYQRDAWVNGLTVGDSYTLNTDVGTIDPTTFTASSSYEAASMDIPGTTTAATLTITLTDQTTGAPTSRTEDIYQPELLAPHEAAWRPIIAVSMFGANEPVDLTYSGPISGPSTLTAPSCCPTVPAKLTTHPGPRPVRVTITATGTLYGRTISHSFVVAGTTLRAGQSTPVDALESETDGPILTTRKPGYIFAFRNRGISDQLVIDHGRGSNETSTNVADGSLAPNLPATLAITRDGNLVIRLARHPRHVYWSTHTAHSGRHNHTKWLPHGVLALVTERGRVLWRSDIGRHR